MSNYEICQVCGGVHYGTCCPSGINKRNGQAMEKVSDEILHEIVEFSGDRIMPLIASELILARQQLEAMKWVPVGERLPEKETTEQWEMYLCKLNRYGEEHIAPLSFVGGSWYSESRTRYDDYVVGWMPLSALPLPVQPEEG